MRKSDSPGVGAEDHRARAMALLPELADHPVPHRRAHHQLTRVVVGVLALLLMAGVFGGFWRYQWWQSNVGEQQAVSAPQLSDAELSAFHSAADSLATAPAGTGAAPIVLTYHDIRPDAGDSQYVVSPKRFAAQMKMLHEAGYRTMTADDLLRYRRGGDVPPRSVLITFDDGTGGLWKYADPVLERYGFTAVAFIISGRVGTRAPYYLTWPQIDRMAASGRWDFGSHTHDLHTKVSSPSGDDVSLLSSRRVVGGERESMAAFRARVSSDLRRSLRDFEAHGLPRPELFAWPFSDVTGDQSDPKAVEAASDAVDRSFTLAFVNAYQPRPATRRIVRSGTVQRLEILGEDTARSVFREVQEMLTIPVQDLRPARYDRTWLEHGGHPAPIDEDRLADDVVTVDARTLEYVAAYWAPQRTSTWGGYRVLGTVAPPKGDGTAGVTVRGDGAGQVALRMSRNVAVVQSGGKTLATRTFSDSGDVHPRHSVKLAVTSTVTRVLVDGEMLAEVPASEGRAAHGTLGVVFSRESADEPWGEVQDLRVRATK